MAFLYSVYTWRASSLPVRNWYSSFNTSSRLARGPSGVDGPDYVICDVILAPVFFFDFLLVINWICCGSAVHSESKVRFLLLFYDVIIFIGIFFYVKDEFWRWQSGFIVAIKGVQWVW